MHVMLGDGLPSGRGTPQHPIELPGVSVVANDHRTIVLVVLALLVLWAMSEK